MECFILAGGESRRFGENKLLYKIKGRRVIEIVVEEALRVFDRVVILTKKPELYSFLGVPVERDMLDLQTPAVGLLTALNLCRGSHTAVLSGDMPLMRSGVLRMLIEAVYDIPAVFEVGGRVHPLVGTYPSSLKEELRKNIEGGDLSLMGFLKRVGFIPIRIDDKSVEGCFLNLNTKEDLERVLEQGA